METFTYSVQVTGPAIYLVGGWPLFSVTDINSFSFIMMANRSAINGVRMATAQELGIICFDESASVFLVTATRDNPPSVHSKRKSIQTSLR